MAGNQSHGIVVPQRGDASPTEYNHGEENEDEEKRTKDDYRKYHFAVAGIITHELCLQSPLDHGALPAIRYYYNDFRYGTF